MRLVSFRHGTTPSYSLALDDEIVDAGSLFTTTYPTLGAILRAGVLDEVMGQALRQAPRVPQSDVAPLPPVTDSGKVLCIGLNYPSHRKETATGPGSAHPMVFTRFVDSHVGHNHPIVKPAVSDLFDYEGEVAVVIGRRARHVRAANALDYVLGYAAYNGGSVRDWQRHTSQWTPGKNFIRSGAFGPCIVAREEMPDPDDVEVRTRVNGDLRQHGRLCDLVFGVPDLIAYLSSFTTLDPGDVIATGTPDGVGAVQEPPAFLLPGDIVEVEVTGVGVLRNPIAAEDDSR